MSESPFDIDAVMVRDERSSDAEAIARVTGDAFRGAAHASGTEERIIDALRSDDALAHSIVAELDGAIVGHVALSRVAISDGSRDWFGLGPISVDPAHQRRGIGSRLMHAALDRLRATGAAGCVLVGDPEYYTRFGFRSETGLDYPGVPSEYVLAIPISNQMPHGIITYHKAFQD